MPALILQEELQRIDADTHAASGGESGEGGGGAPNGNARKTVREGAVPTNRGGEARTTIREGPVETNKSADAGADASAGAGAGVGAGAGTTEPSGSDMVETITN